MDPWQPCSLKKNSSQSGGDSSSETVTDVVGLVELNKEKDTDENSCGVGELDDTEKLTFGDNFQPFVKLPDSQEYLESLERKLKVIQKGGIKGPSADSILRSLGQTKESCMIKLLSNSVEKLTVEGELFEELKVNPILKKLAPEKQALSAEELVHLLKADQLDILLSNNNLDLLQEQSDLGSAFGETEESTDTSTTTAKEQEQSSSCLLQGSEKDRESPTETS